MSFKVFYIIAFVLEYSSCNDIEVNELEVPYELIASSEEYEQSLPAKPNSDVKDHDNIIESDDKGDKDLNEDVQEEDAVSFAGPVQAKGTVAVAANYGYNAPESCFYPSYSTMNTWFPSFVPQYNYPPPFVHSFPYTFPYISTASMILPELESLLPEYNQKKSQNRTNSERGNTSKNDLEGTNCKLDAKSDIELKEDLEKILSKVVKLGKKDFLIEITPIKKVQETAPASKNDMEQLVEFLSPQEMMEHNKVLLDDVFTDYDENYAVVDNSTEAEGIEDKTEADLTEERVVFGGLLPAKGAVKIAARF